MVCVCVVVCVCLRVVMVCLHNELQILESVGRHLVIALLKS